MRVAGISTKIIQAARSIKIRTVTLRTTVAVAATVNVSSEAVGVSCNGLKDDATHFFHNGTASESIILMLPDQQTIQEVATLLIWTTLVER